MIQTGLKQATVAYLATKETGEPLDINGELTSVSGRKQAIALLEGETNPNAALYEVAGYFEASALLEGEPTAEPSPDCPPSSFSVSPLSVQLSPDTLTAVISVLSSGPWAIVGAVPAGFTMSQTSGTGAAEITITRTVSVGPFVLVLKPSDFPTSISVDVLNLESINWILETGAWRNYKLYKNNGLWKFNI